MANQYINSPLKRNITGGHIATVDDIAFSVKTEGSGSLAYETINKSLRTIIEEIQSSIPEATDLTEINKQIEDILEALLELDCTLIKYDDNNTLKEKLDSLVTDTIDTSTLLSYVTSASAYANMALNAYSKSQTYLNQVISEKDTAIDEIDTAKETAVSDIKNNISKLDTLTDLASQLAVALDSSDTNFIITGLTTYEEKYKNEEIDENKIYFLFDDSEEDIDYWTINVTSNDSSYGLASGTGVYAKTDTITLIASPRTGYTFTEWTCGSVSLGTTPTLENYAVDDLLDYVESNTITITANFEKSTEYVTVSVVSDDNVGGIAYMLDDDNNKIYSKKVEKNSSVYLYYEASSNYTFNGWTKGTSTDILSVNNEFSPTISEDSVYIAHYSENGYVGITVKSNDDNLGSVSGGGTFVANEGIATLEATPNEDYSDYITFNNWTSGTTILSTENPLVYNVTEAITIVGNFTTDYLFCVGKNNSSISSYETTTLELDDITVESTATSATGTFYGFVVDSDYSIKKTESFEINLTLEENTTSEDITTTYTRTWMGNTIVLNVIQKADTSDEDSEN